MTATIPADVYGAPDAPRHDLAPVPLAEAPEVRLTLARLGFRPLVPHQLVSHPGRNDNWAGRTEDGHQIFVKRLDRRAPDATGRFDRAYAFQVARAAAGPLSWSAPAFLGGDREALVLVYARLEGAVSGAALAEEDRFDAALARRAGRAVGELHDFHPAGVPGAGARRTRGLASRLSALTVAEYTRSSAAELGFWALLQHDDDLKAALRALGERSGAAAPAAAHGDLRLDQFLLHGDELHLCDWEEFRLADPARDIGGFVGQWLFRAATLMFTEFEPDTPEDPTGADGGIHASLVRGGADRLDAVRPLIAAFWQGYREVRATAGPSLAERAVAYAGWHLFDRVLATATHSARLTAVQRGTAGVGRAALLAPGRFSDVLGLGDDA
ncbi:class V lanthionine synthetase subunit LxmK [Streptomyces sp. ME19-01-6]|uniref:class V lanthionine synthetase subunit LxmK n=1 Tax=Streptomyces sp. ME19-01-6 TaxID=3028686 RepID=UPI0029B97F29|nr:class V lanthionine synthetase subunit LxmK [Streptomyces sp. ME19-01-6]MDX3228061.1 class V lanthionine synthetase subunit LxmK [Streptomyces sp. ME19-01-6]